MTNIPSVSKPPYPRLEYADWTAPPPTAFESAAPPKADSQMVENSDGRKRTPRTNSRTDRPYEIRAMNIPTNGDHAIHQPQ